MSIRLTGYMAGPDNCYPGHPDGGTDTCTGVALDEKYATFAIPGGSANAGRTNLKVGDVVLFQNKTADGKNYTSIGWATDIGGLPHGDIDVAQGALGNNLGLKFEHNKGNTYVTDVKGQGDVSAERLAHISAKGFRNPNVVNEAIIKVNTKLASGELKPEDAQKALADEIHDPANVLLADEESKKVQMTARGGGYGTYADARREGRRPEDLSDYIQNIMKEDPMMGMLLMIVGLLTGAFNISDLTSPSVSAPVREAASQISPQAIEDGKQGIKGGAQPYIPAGKILDSLDGILKSGKLKSSSANLEGLKPETQTALAELAEKFNAATGRSLRITSGYRDPHTQALAMKSNIDQKGVGWVGIYKNKALATDVAAAYPDIGRMTQVIKDYADRGVIISSHMSGDKFDVATSDLADKSKFMQIAGEMKFKLLDEGNHVDCNASTCAVNLPQLAAANKAKAPAL